jgi:hypothetical protein
VDMLPMSGGQGVASSNLTSPTENPGSDYGCHRPAHPLGTLPIPHLSQTRHNRRETSMIMGPGVGHATVARDHGWAATKPTTRLGRLARFLDGRRL